MNIFRKLPYFAAAGLPSPLTHLWFLALVMQFYLVWPLLIMAIGRLVRAKWARTVVMVIIVLASSAAMWLLFDPDDTSRVYYGTDTRLAELAMGAMLAMLMQRADRTADDRKQRDDGRGASAIILDVFGWLSLLALCAGFWFMNGYDDTMYHGGYLVAAILGALALAGAIRGVSLPRVLGCAPLRYLGSRSYSLYLMHYPLLQFMNPATRTEALPWWGWLIEAAVIWTATEAFYQLVEATRMYEPTPRSRHARASVEPSRTAEAGVMGDGGSRHRHRGRAHLGAGELGADRPRPHDPTPARTRRAGEASRPAQAEEHRKALGRRHGEQQCHGESDE